jgi:hypothetical protein
VSDAFAKKYQEACVALHSLRVHSDVVDSATRYGESIVGERDALAAELAACREALDAWRAWIYNGEGKNYSVDAWDKTEAILSKPSAAVDAYVNRIRSEFYRTCQHGNMAPLVSCADCDDAVEARVRREERERVIAAINAWDNDQSDYRELGEVFVALAAEDTKP